MQPMHERAFIAYGSNIRPRLKHIVQALRLVVDTGRVIRMSSVYESRAACGSWGNTYFNGVFELDTTFSPDELLIALKEIEHRVGRKVAPRNAPREIDLDILLMGNRVVDQPELGIPHRALCDRDFALMPLAELEPHVLHPGVGKTPSELLTTVREKWVLGVVLTSRQLRKMTEDGLTAPLAES